MNSPMISQPVLDSLKSILSNYLVDLRECQIALSAQSNEEALHDARVASRRLSTWIKLCADEKIFHVGKREQNKIKKIIKLSNRLRDLEVRLPLFRKNAQKFLENPNSSSVVELQEKWEQKMKIGYDYILQELPNLLAETQSILISLIDRLDKTGKEQVRSQKFGEFIAPILVNTACQLDKRLKKIHDLEDDKIAHKARLLGKKLRYLMEPISKEFPNGPALLLDMKQLQDLLGDIRDGTLLEKRLRKSRARLSDPEADKEFDLLLRENTKEIHKLFEEFENLYLTSDSTEYGKAIASSIL